MPVIRRGELRSILEADMPDVLDRRWDTTSTAAAEATEEAEGPVLQKHDAVVQAEHLPAVLHVLRDNFGYDYLSNITAIDYLEQGIIEVVYQLYNLEGGADLRIRVRVGRSAEECVIPSLTPTWPGANLQEREAYDMYGVFFPGHPNLARIYMWDEFEGFPMRKDFPKTGDKYVHVTGAD